MPEKMIALKKTDKGSDAAIRFSSFKRTELVEGTEQLVSKDLRKITFVNPIKLIDRCEQDIEKIQKGIDEASEDLVVLKKTGEELGQRLNVAIASFGQSCNANERFDAQLMEQEALINVKEMQKAGAAKALADLKKLNAITKKTLKGIRKHVQVAIQGTSDGIAAAKKELDEKGKALIQLNERMEELQKQASKERKKEAFLAEEVTTLQDSVETNVGLMGSLNRRISSLCKRRTEREKDINIIFSKSGLGDMGDCIKKLQHELDEAGRKLEESETGKAEIVANMTNTIEDLKRQLSIKVQLVDKAKEIIAKRDATIMSLNVKIGAAGKGQLDQTQAMEFNRISEELRGQQGINEELRRQLEQARRDLAGANETAGFEISGLQARLEQATQNLIAAGRTNEELARTIDELRVAVDESRSSVAESTEELLLAKNRIQGLTSENETLQQRIGPLNDTIVELQGRLQQAMDETRSGHTPGDLQGEETVLATGSDMDLVRQLSGLKEDVRHLRETHMKKTEEMERFLHDAMRHVDSTVQELSKQPMLTGLKQNTERFRLTIQSMLESLSFPKKDTEPTGLFQDFKAAAPDDTKP